MKQQILLTVILGMSSISMMAQDDDLYFVPKKSVEPSARTEVTTTEQSTNHLGSDRDVDEYNRRSLRSYYQKIKTDSIGDDIISFTEGDGNYPDTIYVEDIDSYDDYLYSRRMGRFDGFYGWYDPYFYGYWGWGRPYWRSAYWGWYDPWYYGYTGWYDPWFYGYYGYYGYGWPYYGYWGGWYGHRYHGGYVARGGNPRGFTGDRTWSFSDSQGSRGNQGTFNPTNPRGQGGNTYTSRSANNRSFGSRTYNNGTQNRNNGSSGRFGSTRPTTSPSSSSSSSRSSGFGGGSVSRSSGSFGGGHVGGGGRSGGSFGGRR